MTDLDNLLDKMERYKGVFNLDRAIKFMFEYATCVAEFNHYTPTQDYLEFVIEDKFKAMAGRLEHTYNRGRTCFTHIMIPPLLEARHFAYEEHQRYRWGRQTDGKPQLQLSASK